MLDKDEFTTKLEPKGLFSSTPTIFIASMDADNIGAYLVASYLFSKAVPKKDDPTKDNYFVEVRFIEGVNLGSVTLKEGSEYKPVILKSGDLATIFASSRLYRTLNQLKPGDRFKAVYQGMKRVKGQKGGAAHHFNVLAGGNSLTEEDRKYVEMRTNSNLRQVVSEVDASEAEKEAVEAMSQLED